MGNGGGTAVPQHLDDAVPHLDLAGGEGRVDRALGAGPDDAGDAHDVLAAHVDGVVDDALHDAGVVADVDEGEVLAVLAPPGDPAAQGHRGADVLGAQLAAQVGAHRRRVHDRTVSRWVSRWARGTTVWGSSPRSGRTTTVPAARSSSPTITRDGGAAAVGRLHLRLHAAAVVGAVGRTAGAAQLVREHQRLTAAGGVDDEHVDRPVGCGEHALVVARQQGAVDADGEPDARRRRPAERLDEAVVPAAAAERVLRRVERAAGELERGAQVVVEAAHEAGLDRVRDGRGRRARRARSGSGPPRRRSGSRPAAARRRSIARVGRPLGVEHAQRVAGERLAALLRELAGVGAEVGARGPRRSGPDRPARRAS